MTDAAWAEGMAELLKAGLHGWPTHRQESAARGDLYRRYLDHLDDGAWLHAVRRAIECERFFPTVAALLAHAEGYRKPAAYRVLPRARTAEQLEEDRAATRRGLQKIRAAYEQSCDEHPPAPKGPPPRISRAIVSVSDERFDELRRQAALIQADS